MTLLAFSLRLYQLDQNSLWYDELLQVDIAQSPLAYILPQLERHAAMPLDYFILHGWIKLGQGEMWVRWPALLWGTLSISLIYRVTRHLFNRRVGLVAAALLTVTPFAIQYSREVRPYALLMLLILLAYFGLWQAYHTGRLGFWVLAGLSLVGAVLTHYFALFMLFPIGIFVVIRQGRHLREAKFWRHTALFGLSLFFVFLSLAITGRFKPVYNVSFGVSKAATQPASLKAPASAKPNRGSGPPVSRLFFIDKVLGPLAAKDPTQLLVYNTFLLIAVATLLFRPCRNRTAILLLIGWLFAPIVAVYLFLLYRGTFYATRYILFTLPAYVILVAYGLDVSAGFVSQRLARSALLHRLEALSGPKMMDFRFSYRVLSLLILFSLSPLLTGRIDELRTYYTTDAREDWRAVGHLLATYAGPDDVIIAVRAEPTMNWYYPPAATPFGAYNRTERVWQAINEHPRRWFVLSSYSRSRDRALREWLQNNGAIAIGIDRRVVLYVQQQGLSAAELLAQVKHFSLPSKSLTYATLARQLQKHGDLETGQLFYEKALDLADPALKKVIETQMAAQRM